MDYRLGLKPQRKRLKAHPETKFQHKTQTPEQRDEHSRRSVGVFRDLQLRKSATTLQKVAAAASERGWRFIS